MGFFDWIDDIWRHRKIAKTNQKQRGVVHYLPSQVGGFVEPDSCFGNTLISGGNAQIRSEAINALCIRAANASLPVIVLHQGDTHCENTLRKTFSGFQHFYLVNNLNPIFDPIYGLPENQIRNTVVNSAPKEYRITPAGGDYVAALTLTMSTKAKNIPLPALISLINNDNVPKLLQAGQLPATVAPTIQHLYTRGQAEIHSVNRYFRTLADQCSAVLPKSKQAYMKCCNLKKVIDSQGVLVLDLISDMNNLYIRLLMELFRDMVRSGQRFLLIVDDLSITEENGLKPFLASQNHKVSKAVASEDLFASCGCASQLFQTLLGHSQKWFVFNHMSDESATQWSKGFGMYEKIETSYNLGKGGSKGSGFGFGYIGWNRNNQYNSGETFFHKDEAKVRSFEIQNLQTRQGFVYTKSNNELAYVSEFTL